MGREKSFVDVTLITLFRELGVPPGNTAGRAYLDRK